MRPMRFLVFFIAFAVFLGAIIPSVRAESVACAPDVQQSIAVGAGTSISLSASCPSGTNETLCSCVPALAVATEGAPLFTVTSRFEVDGTTCHCHFTYNQDTPANTFILRPCAMCDPVMNI